MSDHPAASCRVAFVNMTLKQWKRSEKAFDCCEHCRCVPDRVRRLDSGCVRGENVIARILLPISDSCLLSYYFAAGHSKEFSHETTTTGFKDKGQDRSGRFVRPPTGAKPEE